MIEIKIPDWDINSEIWDTTKKSPVSIQQIEWTHQTLWLVTWCGDFVGLYTSKTEAGDKASKLEKKKKMIGVVKCHNCEAEISLGPMEILEDVHRKENKDLKRKLKFLEYYSVSDRQLEILLNLFERNIDQWDDKRDKMDSLTQDILDTLEEAVDVIKQREKYHAERKENNE